MVIQSATTAANFKSIELTATKSSASYAVENSTSATAALGISTGLDDRSNGIITAQADVANAVSFTQSQSALLQNIDKALGRMNELAQAAQNSAASPADRAAENTEFQSLGAYIAQTAGRDFNGVSLFSGDNLSVNADGNGTTLSAPGIDLSDTVSALSSADISSFQGKGAADALATVRAAQKQISSGVTTAAHSQAQLESVSDQLSVSAENISAVITDFSSADSLTTAATSAINSQPLISLLAQAKQTPQTVLSLLPQ